MLSIAHPLTIGTILLLGFVYHGYVTFLVARSSAFERRQKVTQIWIIWLLPIVGAFLAHRFASNATAPLPRSDLHFVPRDQVDNIV